MKYINKKAWLLVLCLFFTVMLYNCHEPAVQLSPEPETENLCSGHIVPDLRHTGMLYIPNGCTFACGENFVVVKEGGVFFSYSLLNKMVEEERQKKMAKGNIIRGQ